MVGLIHIIIIIIFIIFIFIIYIFVGGMMIASGLVGLSALDEQVIGVIFVLLYLYYRIVAWI